jgi:hypothetical protein
MRLHHFEVVLTHHQPLQSLAGEGPLLLDPHVAGRPRISMIELMFVRVKLATQAFEHVVGTIELERLWPLVRSGRSILR